MAKENFEFFCSHCPADPADKTGKTGAYFFVNWEMTRTGEFLFVCPNCNREHLRNITAGEMKSNATEAMFVGGESKQINIYHTGGGHKPGVERILILKSAWHRGQMLEKLGVVRCGFMAAKWLEKAAKEKGALSDDDE